VHSKLLRYSTTNNRWLYPSLRTSGTHGTNEGRPYRKQSQGDNTPPTTSCFIRWFFSNNKHGQWFERSVGDFGNTGAVKIHVLWCHRWDNGCKRRMKTDIAITAISRWNSRKKRLLVFRASFMCTDEYGLWNLYLSQSIVSFMMINGDVTCGWGPQGHHFVPCAVRPMAQIQACSNLPAIEINAFSFQPDSNCSTLNKLQNQSSV
jgi:hypothetical protein